MECKMHVNLCTDNHIRRNEGTVEDEGGDVDEPLPGFVLLPPDAERQIDRHRNGCPAHQENGESKEFFEEHRKENFRTRAV